ncbi:MAG TPA: hypothetical protein PLU53_13150, partial [Bacteroidia bacterium]|nr:hypothetical protein [Bacteroidia bacterium]
MKEKFTGKFLCVFFLFFISAGIQNTYASHSMGADLTYRCLGGNNYEITLSFYRDCVGVQADQFANINYTSSCYGSFDVMLWQV